MSSPENPRAFPRSPAAFAGAQDGMNLRDWFAGQALAGLLASATYSNAGDGFEEFIASAAGNIADAMLAERAK